MVLLPTWSVDTPRRRHSAPLGLTARNERVIGVGAPPSRQRLISKPAPDHHLRSVEAVGEVVPPAGLWGRLESPSWSDERVSRDSVGGWSVRWSLGIPTFRDSAR